MDVRIVRGAGGDICAPGDASCGSSGRLGEQVVVDVDLVGLHMSAQDTAQSPSSSAPSPGAPPPISMADILDRQVEFAWPEAVALMAEVCAQIVAGDRAATEVPDPTKVLLHADGRLTVEPGRQQYELVGLPRTLHALLEGAQAPTPLRLFVGHAITSGKFATVLEFGEALGYYERPGRQELLQAAYQRYLLAPVDRPKASPAPVVDVAVPQPVEERPAPSVSKSATRTLFAAVFLLVFAGGVLVAVRATTARQGRDAVKAPADLALDGVTAKASNEMGRLRSMLRDFGLPIPAPEVPPSTPKPAVLEPPPAPPEPSTRVVKPAQVASKTAPPVTLSRGPLVTEVARATSPVPQTATPAVRMAALDTELYTSGAEGVTPPVIVGQVLPPALRVGDVETTNQMELLIGADGRVEQVKMISQLERLPDFMLLSGAKNWRFRPAMKDGQPVRYRLPLTWAVGAR